MNMIQDSPNDEASSSSGKRHKGYRRLIIACGSVWLIFASLWYFIPIWTQDQSELRSWMYHSISLEGWRPGVDPRILIGPLFAWPGYLTTVAVPPVTLLLSIWLILWVRSVFSDTAEEQERWSPKRLLNKQLRDRLTAGRAGISAAWRGERSLKESRAQFARFFRFLAWCLVFILRGLRAAFGFVFGWQVVTILGSFLVAGTKTPPETLVASVFVVKVAILGASLGLYVGLRALVNRMYVGALAKKSGPITGFWKL